AAPPAQAGGGQSRDQGGGVHPTDYPAFAALPESAKMDDRKKETRMINLTTAATEKVKAALEQEKANLPQGGLRIYVQGGGCSGFQYGMVLDEVTDGDEVFETGGVKVIVDPMSMRYLEGAEVDYKEDLMGGGFAIKNPNATSTCGCGHSFQA